MQAVPNYFVSSLFLRQLYQAAAVTRRDRSALTAFSSLSALYLFMILDGKTKVSNLAAATAVQEDVVRLDVKMQNIVTVQELQALHHSVVKRLMQTHTYWRNMWRRKRFIICCLPKSI